MKKIIMLLGLSVSLMTPHLSASEYITEDLVKSDKSSNGFYVKSLISGWFPSQDDNFLGSDKKYLQKAMELSTTSYDSVKPSQSIDFGGFNIATSVNIGKHINKYFAVEAGISAYYSHEFKTEFTRVGTNSIDGEQFFLAICSKSSSFNIIDAMLRPVINIDIANNVSLYVTAGVGASYILSISQLYLQPYAYSLVDYRRLPCKLSSDPKMVSNDEVVEDVVDKLEDRFHFAWEVGGGVSFACTDKVSIGLSYKYKNIGQFALKEKSIPRMVLKDLTNDIAFHTVSVEIKAYF